MKHTFLLGLLLLSSLVHASSFKNLPDWAALAYSASRSATKPTDADQWVLLDKTEFAYTGDGEITIHRYRLVEVLTSRGTEARTFLLVGLGGQASKVKKVKGWNLRPDGDLVKLDREDVVAVDQPGDSEGVSNERWTGASLDRVVPGSLIAFESIQKETDPEGPAQSTYVMEAHPIFHWEIQAATQGGWFRSLRQVSYRLEPRNFSPWIPSLKVVPQVSLSADNIPALPKDESATPGAWNSLPRVSLVFLDPDLKGVPSMVSWDGIASWMEAKFLEQAPPTPLPIPPSLTGLEALQAVHQWIRTQLTYKQVYLSPDRGFVPLAAGEVIRRRYGDCKDLVSCFLGAVRAMGFQAYPVLARIPNERIESDEPVHPACFNHVIAAVALPSTLHLQAEVETPVGRLLLVDPTARFTPLGVLPMAHAHGRLLVCAKGKGAWVEVKPSVLEPTSLETTLTGVATPDGDIQGSLSIAEAGNVRGLRSAALGASTQDFQRFLFSSFLALPSNARIRILRQSNPLDLDHPFKVDLEFDDPKGFEIQHQEWDLNAMGIFRVIPYNIQRPGESRRFPVQTFSNGTFVGRAILTVPAHLTPVVSSKKGETPFHRFLWEAQTAPVAPDKTRLSLRFEDTDTPARFGFEDRDAGLAAWQEDRRSMQDLLDDVLAFKVSLEGSSGPPNSR